MTTHTLEEIKAYAAELIQSKWADYQAIIDKTGYQLAPYGDHVVQIVPREDNLITARMFLYLNDPDKLDLKGIRPFSAENNGTVLTLDVDNIALELRKAMLEWDPSVLIGITMLAGLDTLFAKNLLHSEAIEPGTSLQTFVDEFDAWINPTHLPVTAMYSSDTLFVAYTIPESLKQQFCSHEMIVEWILRRYANGAHPEALKANADPLYPAISKMELVIQPFACLTGASSGRPIVTQYHISPTTVDGYLREGWGRARSELQTEAYALMAKHGTAVLKDPELGFSKLVHLLSGTPTYDERLHFMGRPTEIALQDFEAPEYLHKTLLAWYNHHRAIQLVSQAKSCLSSYEEIYDKALRNTFGDPGNLVYKSLVSTGYSIVQTNRPRHALLRRLIDCLTIMIDVARGQDNPGLHHRKTALRQMERLLGYLAHLSPITNPVTEN